MCLLGDLRRITQIQPQFRAFFLCSFALQKSLLEYTNPSSSLPPPSSQPHTHIHTHSDTHRKQKQKMRAKWGRATLWLYLRRRMIKDEKQSQCEIVQWTRWRGAGDLVGFHAPHWVCSRIVWSKTSEKLDDALSLCTTKTREREREGGGGGRGGNEVDLDAELFCWKITSHMTINNCKLQTFSRLISALIPGLCIRQTVSNITEYVV